ncbi:MAG: ATP-binding cassette domain-containing protein [Candidatus Nanopelagicales bacterium]
MSGTGETVLTIRGLHKQFTVGRIGDRKVIDAVSGVDMDIRAGQTTALVGESGSGKSTLARCILGLAEPTSGSITVGDLDAGGRMTRRDRRELHRRVQMVFQDPHASLNPRMTAMATVAEPLKLQLGMEPAARRARVLELFELVQLSPQVADRYPNELSGGQRQRVGIARALAVEPAVLVLDEPTSSLDVSVRGRVIELLQDVQKTLGLGYLFISHDLAVVRLLATDIHVMYHGEIVEHGEAERIFTAPQHPYTKALLDAIPIPEWREDRRRNRARAG